jgi:hypothetical protein
MTTLLCKGCSLAITIDDGERPASITCERCGAEVAVPTARSAPRARVPRLKRAPGARAPAGRGPAAPAAPEFRGPRLDAFDVLRQTAGVLGANFVAFVTVALIATVPVVLAEIFLLPRIPSGRASSPEAELPADLMRLGIELFFSELAAAALAPAVIAHIAGRRLALPEIARRWVASLPRAALASIAVTVTLAMSSILLLPGAAALVTLVASVPAAVLEGLGPLDALARSRDLTQGHRWRVFFASLGLAAVAFMLIALLMTGLRAQRLDAGARIFGISAPVLLVLVLWRAAEAVMQTVIYARLRVLRGEARAAAPASAAVTDVFE